MKEHITNFKTLKKKNKVEKGDNEDKKEFNELESNKVLERILLSPKFDSLRR